MALCPPLAARQASSPVLYAKAALSYKKETGLICRQLITSQTAGTREFLVLVWLNTAM